MSPAEKWGMSEALYRAAWSLKAAGFRMQHPDWEEDRINQAVKEAFLFGGK